MAKKPKKGKKKLKWWNKGQMDIATFIIVMILVLSGLVMILSASSPSALSKTGDSYRYIKTQLIATAFGIVVMYVLSRLNYHKYRKFKWIIYLGLIVLLALVGVMGISAGRSKKMV